jgi:hypothetical protein
MIDLLEWNTFEHKPVLMNHNYAGIFEWGLLFKVTTDSDYPNKPRKYHSEPYW